MKTATSPKTARQPGTAKRIAAKALRTTPPTRKAARKAKPAIPVAGVDTAPKTATQQIAARKEMWRQQIQADVKAEMKRAGLSPSPGIAREIAKVEQQVSAIGRQVAEFGQQMTELNATLIGVAQAAEDQAKAMIEKRPDRSINALIAEAGSIVDCMNNLMADSPLIDAIAARLFDLDELILRTPSANGRDLAAKADLLLKQLDSAEVGQFVMELVESIRDDALSLPEAVPAECTPSAVAETF